MIDQPAAITSKQSTLEIESTKIVEYRFCRIHNRVDNLTACHGISTAFLIIDLPHITA